MRNKGTRLLHIVFLLLVSTFGLIISTSMLIERTQPATDFGERRVTVGLVYSSICLGGMLAAFFPRPCSRMSGLRRSGKQNSRDIDARTTEILGFRLIHGHHSLGDEESTRHELQFEGKSFCASCFGLLAGAAVSLVALTVFLFSSWVDGYPLSFLLYFSGLVGVALGFLPVLVSVGARTRFVLGMVFVAGTCVMLIAMDVATANLAADLFVVLLIVFWLFCRISLHHRN
jgi:hypothetical protein